MKIDAIMIDTKDNVATALKDLANDTHAIVRSGNNTLRVELRDSIPYGHKFAIKDIRKGEDIIKYGEVIGRAIEPISKGKHVHIHNVESLRGRGDLVTFRGE